MWTSQTIIGSTILRKLIAILTTLIGSKKKYLKQV